ncbi:helix-turn-helix transcriptional regulator [Streptomyces sp. NPDC026589]|uniref:helix-turn-helix domain-containing protein n=1 Tax=Streptomyces sp. NPDC026589 TaxID=3155609 RepID=UPI0033F18B06
MPNPETGVGRLAQHLRDGLARRGLTYRELAVLTRYHPTSLQRAADGKQVPSWKVVEEFAKGCDMTVSQVRRLWLAARRERPGHRVLGSAPGVDQIYDASDLGVHLAALREKRGSPSYRLMEKRAESTEAQFGRLPRSTAQRITARETTPSLLQMQAFLIGCGLPGISRSLCSGVAAYGCPDRWEGGGPVPEGAGHVGAGSWRHPDEQARPRPRLHTDREDPGDRPPSHRHLRWVRGCPENPS